MWLDTLERIRASNIKLETDYKEAVRQKEEAERAVEERFAAAEQLSQQMRDKEVQADQLRFAIQSREATIRELESAGGRAASSNIQHNLENTQRIREELEQREGRQDSSIRARSPSARARLAEIEQQLDQTRRRAEEQNAAGPGGLRSPPAPWPGSWRSCGGQEAMETADAHRGQGPALRPGRRRPGGAGPGRDGAPGAAGAWRSGWRTPGRTPRRRPRRSWPRPVEERDACRTSSAATPCAWSPAGRRRSRPGSAISSSRWTRTPWPPGSSMLTEMEKVHEGYSKAVKLVMGEARPGQPRGISTARWPGLLHVPDQYTVAIETALGGAMQNLVVEREEDGKAVIQYLKRRDGGRATIPAPELHPALRPAGGAGLRREPGFVGVGDQLVAVRPPVPERVFQPAGPGGGDGGPGRGHRRGPEIRL